MQKTNIKLIATAAVCILAAIPAANASFSISASPTGGALASATKYNFDTATVGSSSPLSYSGMSVIFSPDAKAVTGAMIDQYAAPYVSGQNDVGFSGQSVPLLDTTVYLTSGIYNGPIQGSITMEFNSPQNYLGLLWGSVDDYNTLTFSMTGVGVVGTVTGLQVNNPANGNQNIGGTVYANIFSSLLFDKVVATSTQYAFEIDNVAVAAVPEPTTIIAGALLLLPFGLSTFRSLRRNRE